MLKQSNKLKTNQKGFTIIEVLIVLAIAGLIMLVVFLAVPALNRSSHNQQYKTEGNNIMAAYNEAYNNNGGNALTTSVYNVAAPNDASRLLAAANTKSITALSIIAQTTTTQTPPAGSAVIVLSTMCSLPGSGSPTIVGATSRNASIIYGIESTSGPAVQCITR